MREAHSAPETSGGGAGERARRRARRGRRAWPRRARRPRSRPGIVSRSQYANLTSKKTSPVPHTTSVGGRPRRLPQPTDGADESGVESRGGPAQPGAHEHTHSWGCGVVRSTDAVPGRVISSDLVQPGRDRAVTLAHRHAVGSCGFGWLSSLPNCRRRATRAARRPRCSRRPRSPALAAYGEPCATRSRGARARSGQ